MKLNPSYKILIVLGIQLFAFTATYSQSIQIHHYSSYVFNSRFDSYYNNTAYYRGRINGGYQWGAGIEYRVSEEMGYELLYLRQDTKAPTTYYSNGVKSTNFDLGINYILGAGIRYANLKNAPVEFYGGILGGGAVVSLKNPESSYQTTRTKLAWGLRAGANLKVTNYVGLKLQAQLVSAIESIGGSFYFGTGGSGAGIAAYSSLYQFGLGGGLVFRIPSKASAAPRTATQ
jgi:hypothetical protein